MNFYERIKKLLDISNSNIMQMCKDIGISRANISMGEKRNTLPSADTLIKIAQYFNVSTDYLLGYEPNKENNQLKQVYLNEQDSNLYNLIQELSEHDKDEVVNYIKFRIEKK